MLDRDGWRDCAEMMDLRVWVDCEREVCRARTIERNFAAGIVATREECAERGVLTHSSWRGVLTCSR
jgi:pantothenate kinase